MTYEKDIEALLSNETKRLGGLCIKHGQDGWPDRIVLLPNERIIWVELKRDDGTVSQLQKWRAKQLRSLGFTVEVPRSKEDVEQLLRKWENPDTP